MRTEEEAQTLIRPGERLDDLQRAGLRILQRQDGFRFGTDAVLLADFAAAKRGERVCDMGTGTGVLPLLIAARSEETTFDAKRSAQRAERPDPRAQCGLPGRIFLHRP